MEIPPGWGEARISYLHTKGSKTEISNCRPISLLSVIAKTFTKSWINRLQRAAEPHLVCEQGCCRKEQGAPEHLWGFTAQVEACLDGGPDRMYLMVRTLQEPMPCLQMTLCPRQYDQVWRDGL